MKMKNMSLTLVVSGLVFTECDNQQQNNTSSVAEETQTKADIVMYTEYAAIPDFGKMYGIEANAEKEQLISIVVEAGLLKVYDVPENQKSDVEEWKTKLVENGFELVDQTDADGESINTYQNNTTSEIVVARLAKSTAEEGGYVFILTVKENATAALPTADDPNMEALIEQQNRIQNISLYLIQDNWVYGWTPNENRMPITAKVRLDGTDYTPILDFGGCDISIEEGFVYVSKGGNESGGIYKVRTSGEDVQQIISVDSPTIQVSSGYIYYTPGTYNKDGNHSGQCHLYRCKMDGSEIEEIISKPVFYWCVLNNMVLYQDDADNESLHLYSIDTKIDQKINDQPSYCPIYDGEYIYYTSSISEGSEGSNLWKVKPDGSSNQKIGDYKVFDNMALYQNYIYFSNTDDNDRIYRIDKTGNNLLQITQDKNCVRLAFFGNYLTYVAYGENYKYIDKTILCNPDGSNATSLFLGEW